MKKNRWLIAVIALISTSVLAIGGVIFYGTVARPIERQNADREACNTLDAGLRHASAEAKKMASKTPAPTNDEIAKAFLAIADKAIGDSFSKAASKGELSDALARLSFSRLSGSGKDDVNAVSDLMSNLSGVQAVCVAYAPTPSPSATN
jgi:hypothetical protein